MSGPFDPYAVLGVPPDADAGVIRAAYLALMQQHHPDRRSGDAAASEERTKQVNAAFAVLADPGRRVAYDRSREARAPIAAAPTVRRTPGDLQRAASQRTHALALGAAVAAGAVVALGAVVASRASGHAPVFSLDRFGRAAGAEAPAMGAQSPAGPMLPWPRGAEAHARDVAGLRLAFADAGLTVHDAAGRAAVLSLPDEADLASARYGVGRLDPESPGASVVVAFRKSGETCCSQIKVAGRTDAGWTVLDLGARPGPPLDLFPAELDGDGVPEFVLPDRRFVGAFGPPERALLPRQILQIRGGRVVDVSDSGRFHTTFRQEMEAARPICALGSNSACAAFVANAARIGRLQWAWSEMLQGYDRDARWPFPTGCADEVAPGPCQGGRGQRFRSYPAALADFLRRTGYAREAPLGLGDLTPSPASAEAPRPPATPGSPG